MTVEKFLGEVSSVSWMIDGVLSHLLDRFI